MAVLGYLWLLCDASQLSFKGRGASRFVMAPVLLAPPSSTNREGTSHLGWLVLPSSGAIAYHTCFGAALWRGKSAQAKGILPLLRHSTAALPFFVFPSRWCAATDRHSTHHRPGSVSRPPCQPRHEKIKKKNLPAQGRKHVSLCYQLVLFVSGMNRGLPIVSINNHDLDPKGLRTANLGLRDSVLYVLYTLAGHGPQSRFFRLHSHGCQLEWSCPQLAPTAEGR
jgi:hypothetical protein